jgi:hypothetical protein
LDSSLSPQTTRDAIILVAVYCNSCNILQLRLLKQGKNLSASFKRDRKLTRWYSVTFRACSFSHSEHGTAAALMSLQVTRRKNKKQQTRSNGSGNVATVGREQNGSHLHGHDKRKNSSLFYRTHR